MSRTERWNARDQTYSRAHRLVLPELWKRTGHRSYVCDRDWTEFCCYCKEPLALVEEVRDTGKDLTDKGITVTSRLAARAGLPAYLAAWRVDRPDEVQVEIDRLNQQVRELEAAYPIVAFTVKQLAPRPGPFVVQRPEEWWRTIHGIHVAHWAACPAAQRRDGHDAGLAGEVRLPLHIQGVLPS